MTITEIVRRMPYYDKCHLCSDCIMLLGPNYGCYETTQDVHYCQYAYCDGVEKEDNGMGYWVTKCQNHKSIDQRIIYKEWIRSEEWKVISKRKKKAAGYKCEICGSAMNLAVHHMTYNHLCHEGMYMDDLLVVCKNCHEKLHEKDMMHDEYDPIAILQGG